MRNEKMSLALDLRGLDMVTPVDLLKDGRTPFSKNFRLYAQQSDDRRVAVSSRKGPGFFTYPVGETLSASNTASTGASTAKVGVIAGLHAQPLTAPSNGLLTRIDVKVQDVDQASGPISVKIYSDKDGKPYKLMSESSLLGGDIGETANYVTARFLKAPTLVSGTQYWVVLVMQDDGKNEYTLATTTSGTKAWKSDSTLSQIEQQTYALNYRTYLTPSGMDKGSFRFNRDNAQNITVVVFGTSLYRIDESTGQFIEVIGGLSALATEYSFTTGDGKVFWANGFDELTAWNGTDENLANSMIANGGFDTNTTGWAAGSGTTLSRVTSDFKTGPASLQAAASSGIRKAMLSIPTMYRDHRYKITYWVKGATTTNSFELRVNNGTGTLPNSSTALTTSWAQKTLYYTPGLDITTLDFTALGDNFLIDDVKVVDTGIEYIRDTELAILSQVTFHKDRLFGVEAADKNRMVFSEAPGNPAFNPAGTVATTKREQWYYAWRSVSFWYVPRPMNGSPITGLISFQDSLTIFTQDKKYIFSGYDLGSFNLRESTGSKGALSRRGITSDENRIFFVGSDGLYEFDGSSDKKISSLVNPLFDGCGQKEMITPVIWKQDVRFYMASQGSPVNDTCLIWNKDIQEMQYDTGTYVNRALFYNDADDDQQLVEFSSLVPTAYFAEVGYHSLGAPIDFEYRLKYDSMSAPAQRKRIKRYFPILQGVDSTFKIQLAMDKDFQDSPRVKDVLMSTNGGKWGEFKWGDGTLYGGDKSFAAKRQSYSGYAYYWQLRVMRKAVNNRVAFIGAQFSYKTKRL